MGAGKTTYGRLLSKMTNWKFYDLDQEIERRAGRTIPEIFAEFGEAHFRQVERETLVAFAKDAGEEWILSCGGGTPCFQGNMELLKSLGKTYYLKVEPDTLAVRLLPQKDDRPLIARLKEDELEPYISALLEKREPYYLQADEVLEVQDMHDWMQRLQQA